MKTLAQHIIALTLLLLAGCVVLPIPTGEQTALAGKPVKQEQLTFLTTNVTTKSQVIGRLGQPDVIWEDANLFVYYWTMRRGILLWAVGGSAPGAFAAGIEDIPRRYALLIQFDQNGRVRRFERVLRRSFQSDGDFLWKWMTESASGPPEGSADRKE